MIVNIVIIALVAVGVFFGARRALGTATGKRDCCSGDAKSSAKKFKNAHITDTDESHYPYAADFSVAGMSCENCARNVTNALDSIDGTWATVDLEGRTAHVLSKNPIDAAAYKSVVSEAGYRIVA
jgi:copper chaperone CopZ